MANTKQTYIPMTQPPQHKKIPNIKAWFNSSTITQEEKTQTEKYKTTFKPRNLKTDSLNNIMFKFDASCRIMKLRAQD